MVIVVAALVGVLVAFQSFLRFYLDRIAALLNDYGIS